MGLIKSAIRTAPKMAQNFVGAPSFRYKNPYVLDLYDEDRYASIYPSIKAISNEFMKIRPFAIGADGERKEQAPALDALYHPNQLDSAVGFREKLAVMNLTHRNTYVLVWRREGNEAKPGGDLRANNIAGYTFLENPAITRRDGVTIFSIGAQNFTDKEVITIPGGVDPGSLYTGYAPGIASARWATLDEYIADFQKGFFENGAVPAGQFVITSASTKDFNDTVDKLEESHKGSGRNNNVTYTPRPVDPTDGKPAQAKIEWIPFQVSNREIDFKNLFDQANKRIDSTFGVPASIRGVGENNNYATARLDQQNFIRFTVEPLALRIFNQITHELNRITGGLGVAITFKLDYPAIADEEKVQAETRNVQVSALLQLTGAGYTLETAINALELPEVYKSLELGVSDETTGDDDKPDVDEGDEVTESPDPERIDGVTPLNAVRQKDFDKLYKVARGTMKRQVDKAVSEITEDDIEAKAEVNPDPTQEEENQFVDDMMVVISAIIVTYGTIQYGLGKDLLESAGIDTDNLTDFNYTDQAEDRYRMYLKKVGNSYMSDTADSIRSVLLTSRDNGLNLADTKRNLRHILDADEYRIKRLAETELNRSQAMGSIESMREIKNQTGARIEKGLLHTGGDAPCEFCVVLLDKWVEVDQDFVLEGETVYGADGGIFINNFVANDGYDLHPNGHCTPHYRVAGAANNAKIQEYKSTIKALESQVDELDGRTKEAKELKAQIDGMEKYIAQLEGIIDGQG